VQAMREAGPRLFSVHMKDLADFKNKESQVAVEEGLMPVREMFAALIAMRTRASLIWNTTFMPTIQAGRNQQFRLQARRACGHGICSENCRLRRGRLSILMGTTSSGQVSQSQVS